MFSRRKCSFCHEVESSKVGKSPTASHETSFLFPGDFLSLVLSVSVYVLISTEGGLSCFQSANIDKRMRVGSVHCNE